MIDSSKVRFTTLILTDSNTSILSPLRAIRESHISSQYVYEIDAGYDTLYPLVSKIIPSLKEEHWANFYKKIIMLTQTCVADTLRYSTDTLNIPDTFWTYRFAMQILQRPYHTQLILPTIAPVVLPQLHQFNVLFSLQCLFDVKSSHTN